MDFQFVIPHNSAELLNSTGNNYLVKQVHNAREIPDLLKAARNAFTSSDSFFIFDHFDTFFALIENANTSLLQSMMRAGDLLFLSIDKHGRTLATHLADKAPGGSSSSGADGGTGETSQQNGDNGDAAGAFDREAHLNLTKMQLYLSIGFVRAIDTVLEKSSMASGGNASNAGRAGGKKSSASLEIESLGWEEKRYRLMLQVYNMFQLPLQKLWSLCIAEENFVNMICDLAYRTLEQPAIREKRVADMAFQLLGTAIKRYNHALTFPVRLQQILRSTEMSVVPAARGLHVLHSDFGITTIYAVVLKDLVDTLAVDAADVQTIKHFGMFLAELGATQPKLLMPHLSQMGVELLNLDSYVLRNTVLQLMGDTIVSELSSEQLSDELKEIREEFLEDLLDHIVDVSAHVRSKSLQIWSHLRAENSVPLAWQHRVLRAAAERLEDKGTLVRKNAVLLIKAFLETNPFAAKLSLQELTEKCDVEAARLQEIREQMLAVAQRCAEMQTKWEAMAELAMTVIAADLAERPLETAEMAAPIEPITADGAEVAKEILELLLNDNLTDAIRLLRRFDRTNADELRAMPVEQQVQYYAVLLRSYMFLEKDHTEEYNTQEQTVKFLDDSIQFAQVMVQAVPAIENMMLSKINSDVFEAIEFFTTAHLFGIKGTETGMRKMLFLVWSGDKEKRETVSRAYHRVLFGTDQEGRSHTLKVVSNLCEFFAGLTLGQFSAMEELMKEWIDNNDIDSHIIQVLFERLTLKLPDTTENMARLALQLLVTAATVRPSIVGANFELIQTIAFSDRFQRDPRLFAACLDLMCCQTDSATAGDGIGGVGKVDGFHRRYENDSDLVENALRLYQRLFFQPAVRNFDAVTISTLDMLYHLGSTPDLLGQQLVTSLCKRLLVLSAEQQTGGDLVDATLDDGGGVDALALTVPEFVAPRLVHLIGYLALKELVYLDIDVYSNMRYRQELDDLLKKSQRSKNRIGNANTSLAITVADGNTSRRSINPSSMSASKALKRLSESATEQDPDDILDGATAEDSCAELILHICETQLYATGGICAQFVPVFMAVLRQPGRYANEHLQQAASLCLIRFMTVSARFCEENMPFLMNVLQQTQNVRIKCNIMVGLSDITFRFPNVVQSWTSHIYATLHESNDEIRLTSVKMLSHLIQHEMIRVKGQISDLAMCIVDSNAEIRHITIEFFKVISQKSNILYNVLPDIISRLSGAQTSLKEEQYHVIMRYVMGLIQKDRQVESLVEKLCLRFRVTQEQRQWRDIAFCLSLLNYTEKTMRKLIEHIPNFKDKVQEDEVHESFKTIIAVAGKTAKPEFKAIIADFEARLADCLRVRDGNATGDSNASGEGARRTAADADGGLGSGDEMPPPKRIPRGRVVVAGKKGAAPSAVGKRGAGGGRGAAASSAAAGRQRQPQRRRANQSMIDDSDDDGDDDVDSSSDSDEEVMPVRSQRNGKTSRAAKTTKTTGKTAAASNSDSEDSDNEVQKRKKKHR